MKNFLLAIFLLSIFIGLVALLRPEAIKGLQSVISQREVGENNINNFRQATISYINKEIQKKRPEIEKEFEKEKKELKSEASKASDWLWTKIIEIIKNR